MLPSLIVAVTTPVVLASIVFACATVAIPLTVATTLLAVSIVAALIAVEIPAAVPVNVPTDPALMRPDVRLSRLLRSAAETVASESVTASLPRPVTPAVV